MVNNIEEAKKTAFFIIICGETMYEIPHSENPSITCKFGDFCDEEASTRSSTNSTSIINNIAKYELKVWMKLSLFDLLHNVKMFLNDTLVK